VKADRMRDSTVEELELKLRELKEELFNLRFRNATNNLDNPMKIPEVKRDIARVMTVMKEMELGIKRSVS